MHTHTLFLPSFLVLHPLPARLWLVASFLVPGAMAGAPRRAGLARGSVVHPSPALPSSQHVSCARGGCRSFWLCVGFPPDVQPIWEADSAASDILMRCKLFVMLPYLMYCNF